MQIQKQIRQLENRLEKALIKFNEAIAHNKSLREEIDGLRRERVVFDSIYKKLEKELDQKKKEMANIIEISNSAYESRDQAQQEMQALKKQLEEDRLPSKRNGRILVGLLKLTGHERRVARSRWRRLGSWRDVSRRGGRYEKEVDQGYLGNCTRQGVNARTGREGADVRGGVRPNHGRNEYSLD